MTTGKVAPNSSVVQISTSIVNGCTFPAKPSGIFVLNRMPSHSNPNCKSSAVCIIQAKCRLAAMPEHILTHEVPYSIREKECFSTTELTTLKWICQSKNLRLLVYSSFLSMVIACGGDDGSGSSPTVIAPIVIQFDLNVLSPNEQELFFAFESVEFRANVTNEAGVTVPAQIHWSSNLEGAIGSGNQIILPLSPGVHFLSVTATTDGVSLLKGFPISVVRDRDANEALVLGTGSLGADFGCPQAERWSAFPRGSAIVVNVLSSISGSRFEVISGNTDIVGDVTNGQISAELRIVTSIEEPFLDDSVNIIEHDDPQSQGCVSEFACAQFQWNVDGSIRSSFVVVRPDQDAKVFAHELGHGIFGLCHVDGDKILAGNSVMSAPTAQFSTVSASLLSKLDRNTIARFFSSSVDPGADRSAIVAAGLID